MEGGIGAAAFRLSPALRSEHSGGRVGAVRCGAVRRPRGDTASAAPIPHTAQSSREPRNTLKKTYSYIQYL